jgi:ABC-2 type transport system permease protein
MRSVLPVFGRSLRDSWRGLIGWSVAIIVLLAVYLPIYTSFGGGGAMQQIIDMMPPALINTLGYGQLTSGAGYVQATFLGLIGFLIFTIAGTSWGAAAIGGSEESGRLELDLAHGIGRVQYALEQTLSILVRMLVLGVVAGLTILALNGPSSLGVEPANVPIGAAALVGLALLPAAAAMLAGALSGRRAVAVAVGAGLAVAAYVVNAVGNQSEDLRWLKWFSPYAWAYREPPLEGGDPLGISALWVLSALLIAGAVVALQRRDVLG